MRNPDGTMAFLPTSTMGTRFLRMGEDDGPDGALVGNDGVSSLTGERPDRRMVCFNVAVRPRPHRTAYPPGCPPRARGMSRARSTCAFGPPLHNARRDSR